MKKMLKLLALLIGVGIIYAGTMLFLIIQGTKDIPAENPDTLLILGAQVKGSSKETAYPSSVLKERLNEALTYIEENPQATIIVCGGQGKDEPDSEANVMANYLIEHNVDQEKIVKEDLSTSTKENIANAMEKEDLGKTVIITSDFHIYRSKMLARRLGLKEVSGLPARSRTSVTANMYSREVLALGFAVIFSH
ncbi:YdcF family protein [uncultured Enterococcus sp.]|uniref:YdcF family protein n=1 Tax=uncultured Enterococcus sp. TaxID=167972 RepID=UPI002AA9174D|nr:YdcF family protein [uncultured Enterococcus sp.]